MAYFTAYYVQEVELSCGCNECRTTTIYNDSNMEEHESVASVLEAARKIYKYAQFPRFHLFKHEGNKIVSGEWCYPSDLDGREITTQLLEHSLSYKDKQ